MPVLTPPPLTTPAITSIKISSITRNSAIVEWESNILTQGKLFLSGGNVSSKVYFSESGTSFHHVAHLTQLSPSTTYSFHIEAIAGQEAATKDESFTTKDDEYIISAEVKNKRGVETTSITINTGAFFKVRIQKNGAEYLDHQNITMTNNINPQVVIAETNTVTSGSDWHASFDYTPRIVGHHYITFTWDTLGKTVSKTVDIYGMGQ